MTAFDTELAKQVRELIRKYPERHNQEIWSSDYSVNPAKSCGTSACIAGWVAAARGFTVAQIEGGPEGDEFYNSVPYYAQAKLGLTEEQADAMFYCWENDRALAMLDHLIETEGRCNEDDMISVADSV